MPNMFGSENSIKKRFFLLKQRTDNFQKIDPNLISKDPTNVRLFRLIIGYGLKEMAELVNKQIATIAQYESGRIKSIPTNESERMMEIIKKEFPDEIDFVDVIATFNKLKEKSKGGIVSGMNRAEKAKLTTQEEKIRDILVDCGVSYALHKTLDTKIGPFNVDFLVNGSMVIECTTAKNKIKAESLAFRIIKIKEYDPKMKAIAIIPKDVTRGFIRRLEDFDYIINEDNLFRLKVLLVP